MTLFTRLSQIIVVTTLLLTWAQAQDCSTNFLLTKGAMKEMTMYKDGQPNGKAVFKVNDVAPIPGGMLSSMHIVAIDGKGKEIVNNSNARAECINSVFMLDMHNVLPSSLMAQAVDQKVADSDGKTHFPSSMQVGMTLDDAILSSKMGQSAIRLTISIINRKVVGQEKVETPAGTFDCFKITYDAKIKAVISITSQGVEWYSPGHGIVKTESYKKGRLTDYSLLTKLENAN